ncbi:serine acetyltransferase [Clostridium perfringens]
MNEYIKSDLYRYRGTVKLKDFIHEYRTNSAFRFMVAFRLKKSNGIEYLIGCILWKMNRNRKISIPIETQIGYGLYIAHEGPVVINPTTVIGDNCNLSQNTTIGANEGKAATIGDNVYVGPNVCLVENVVIGDNVTIGAGSIITKNIPKNATAAGNYAKVLNYNNPGRYIKNKWNLEK